jgi:hypothetical protein
VNYPMGNENFFSWKSSPGKEIDVETSTWG